MLQVKFINNNKVYPARNVYNEETSFNGVVRPSLSIEIDGGTIDIAELYSEFEDISNTGNISVTNGFSEDIFSGYILPLSFKVEYREVERETLTTVQVLKKVITLVIATKTVTEVKADPTNDLLAVSTLEILELRDQVRTLESQLQLASSEA